LTSLLGNQTRPILSFLTGLYTFYNYRNVKFGTAVHHVSIFRDYLFIYCVHNWSCPCADTNLSVLNPEVGIIVWLITALSIAAVMGCPSGCRLSKQWSCYTRTYNKDTCSCIPRWNLVQKTGHAKTQPHNLLIVSVTFLLYLSQQCDNYTAGPITEHFMYPPTWPGTYRAKMNAMAQEATECI